MIKKQLLSRRSSLFALSLVIVALGQPARLGLVGAIAAAVGFALFFASLPSVLSKRRRFLTASFWFALVQAIQLSWMSSIEFQGYYILFLYAFLCIAIGLQFGAFALLIPSEGRLSPLYILGCAGFWTLMEWVRLSFICGFTWNPVGLALTEVVYSLQFASVFGVFGLSFWVIATNLAALSAWRSRKRGEVIGWAALAATPYLFGAVHLSHHLAKSEGKGIAAALVQTALLPSEKVPYPGRLSEHVSAFKQWDWIAKGLKEKFTGKWDLVVLPEAVVPLQSDKALYPYEAASYLLVQCFGPKVLKDFPVLEYPYAEEKLVNGQRVIYVSNLFWCQTLCNHFGAELVTGLDHTDKGSRKNFNSIFYLTPGSSSLERYDKQILLPLAEYLPMEFLRPLTKGYGIFEFFTRGDGAKIFGGKNKLSPSVCYEDTFAEVMRRGRVKGADLFVNVTNDNYYPHSSLHEQHLFHARLRAVENGIPLIRSCNSGVSAAIDCFGRISARMGVSKDSSNRGGGVLSCRVNTYTLPTLYLFWGDACIVCCSLLFFLWSQKNIYYRILVR